MLKVQIVIRIVLFSFYFLFIQLTSRVNSQKLSGVYKLNEGSEATYKYYSFKETGTFEYHEGGCLGEFYYGIGKYNIKNDSIYFYFKKNNDDIMYESYQLKKYSNDSKKNKLLVNVFNEDTIPLEGANVYFEDNLTQKIIKGGMADSNGSIFFSNNKIDKLISVRISHLGYKPQNVYIDSGDNYIINVFLIKKTKKGKPINSKIHKFKLIDINDNYFIINKNGRVERWYKNDTH
jgi:hypothetical protein